MNLLYITFINLFSDSNRGIHKKIASQCRSFEMALSRQVFYTTRVFETAELLHDGEIIDKAVAVDRDEYCNVVLGWIEKYTFNKVYVRYQFCDGILSNFFMTLRQQNVNVVTEIPTYPYDGELKEGLCKFEDSMYREQLSEYVDLFTTYSNDLTIWKKPCVNLLNGIDVSDVLENVYVRNDCKEIRFIAVLSMNPWHGLERIIKGFSNYYINKAEDDIDIHLIVIGDGPERKYYEYITKEYQLENRISYIGAIEPEKIKNYYIDEDIAVGSLGMYKVDMENASPIKGAEYCANGLPIVCGYKDVRFPEDTPFILRVPNDDTPIDIFAVIEWFDNLSKDKDYKKKICDYARDNLTWDSIMKPVIDYFEQVS